MTMVLFGLSGGSMSAFGHHRLSHAAFTWPLIAPFTLYQWLTGTHEGWLIGFACLRLIGEVLSQTVSRPEDDVARYGGEEFIAMLSNTGPDGATHVANTILEHVRAAGIPHAKSEHGIVTLCIGLAITVPDKGARLESLIQQADEALYQAKAAGRNRLMQAPGA